MQRNDLLVAGEVDKQTVLNQRLSAAIASGNLNEVRALAARGAALFKDDPDETAPLIQAITLNNYDMVATLVDLMVQHSYYNRDGSPRYSALVSLFNSPCLKAKYMNDKNLKINLRQYLAAALEREADIVVKLRQIESFNNEIRGLNHILTHVELLQGKGGLFRAGEKTTVTKIRKKKDMLESSAPGPNDWPISTPQDICGLAASVGHLATVAEMINAPAVNIDLECVISNSFELVKTLLEHASSEGNVSLVNFLISKGAGLNVGRQGPLILAITNGHTHVVKVLIEAGADLFKLSELRRSPLGSAVNLNQEELIRCLLDAMIQKTPRHFQKKPAFFSVPDDSIYSPIIKHLNDIDIRKQYSFKTSPKALIRACLVAALSKKVEALKAEGDITALQTELQGLEEICLKLNLLQGKGGFGKTKPNKAAKIAIEALIEDVKSSIRKLETRPEISLDALFEAAMSGNIVEVERLLQAGIDINSQDELGRTALYRAASFGRLDVVRLLIDRKAGIDLVDKSQATPLYIASQQGYAGVVASLIQANAAIDSVSSGVNPLYIASQQDHLGVVDVLIQANAAIDLASRQGATPLYIASHQGHVGVVKFLIQAGASINQARLSSQARTPLDIALSKKKPLVVNAIKEAIDKKIRSLLDSSYSELVDYLNGEMKNYRHSSPLRKTIRLLLTTALYDKVKPLIDARVDDQAQATLTEALQRNRDGFNLMIETLDIIQETKNDFTEKHAMGEIKAWMAALDEKIKNPEVTPAIKPPRAQKTSYIGIGTFFSKGDKLPVVQVQDGKLRLSGFNLATDFHGGDI